MEQGGGRQLDVLKYLFCFLVALAGFGLLRVSRRERAYIKLIDRPVTSPRDGQRVAVCGTLEAGGEPLQSPVRHYPCVLYHYTVLHYERWQTGTKSRKEVVDYAGYGATPCHVEGPHFRASLGAFPRLHDFGEKYFSSDASRSNMKEYLAFTKFAEMKRGEIEWLDVSDDLWAGGATVTRDFRSGSSRPIEECQFHETAVRPGERVCAIGIWSSERNALVATKEQALWVYRGRPETVREVLSSSVGCGSFLGFLMLTGGIAGIIYLAIS